MTIILDIETNNLLENLIDYTSFPYKLKKEAKLWCISIKTMETNKTITLYGDTLTKENLQKELKDCTILLGHNSLKFDLLFLQLFGILDYKVGYKQDTLYGNPVQILDTLILSRLFYPDRFGGHSLKAWGERLGYKKIDYRQLCIDKGYIAKNAEKGEEFKEFHKEMIEYCETDVEVTEKIFKSLSTDYNDSTWTSAILLENKLADKAIRRELLGFDFNKDIAIANVKDLEDKISVIASIVEPLLPPKPMTKSELIDYTPPKTIFKKDNTFSSHFNNFIKKHNLLINTIDNTYLYEGKKFPIDNQEPIKTHTKGVLKHLDHVKMHLISLNWEPLEWKERDLTKDSKKISLPYEKRIKALERWYQETMDGKYKELRLEILGIPEEQIIPKLSKLLKDNKPVRVPTSPNIRIGLEKELCPSLVELGEKVAFAQEYANYLTYKHRKTSIAGGELEDMDFETDTPEKGYLSYYREEDGRVPTPSIEIGSATNRYRHIAVVNLARTTSLYGEHMRIMFGPGKNKYQQAFDFSSLISSELSFKN